MNRHRSNYSAMGTMVSIDAYNKDVSERDIRTVEILNDIKQVIKDCPDIIAAKRLVYSSLSLKYPLYHSELTDIMQNYWGVKSEAKKNKLHLTTNKLEY